MKGQNKELIRKAAKRQTAILKKLYEYVANNDQFLYKTTISFLPQSFTGLDYWLGWLDGSSFSPETKNKIKIYTSKPHPKTCGKMLYGLMRQLVTKLTP